MPQAEAAVLVTSEGLVPAGALRCGDRIMVRRHQQPAEAEVCLCVTGHDQVAHIVILRLRFADGSLREWGYPAAKLFERTRANMAVAA